MKKPWLAFLLNFLLPGAGLAYLGMWGWAVLNLIVVLIVGFVLASAVAPDSLGAVSGLGAGSGGLAMSLATSRNANAKAQVLSAPTLSAYAAVAAAGSNPSPVVPPGAKFCGSCGAAVSSSKFCGACGKAIRPTNQCPACGAVLEGPSAFCTECGHTTAGGS